MSQALNIPKSVKGDGGKVYEISQTPGGQFYGTTPGGTRIKYDRNALLAMRNSPYASSPPRMAHIPGVTINTESPPAPVKEDQEEEKSAAPPDDNDELFEME
mmetsp:Transcript_1910/g.2526  ORF Transcript_1910/g.2526 Transcript_1910/m.2526 type:complete len:102 (-) Transcript_1910:108-413(-)|eukprot:CAMPEP_0175097800 /NCGR_PEP_ID=MMETSP0086_2-20121207/5487_1 /TAXON_ID=136419 /ORGANISM="Unknown Unknown, Strain D1" /LENGTH=101 /DNA_ID=CAMNT_0016371349 /DNA_START=27 /DNA_END=332 /DNA_ORIENTATION=+